jgi:hypothetical protein
VINKKRNWYEKRNGSIMVSHYRDNEYSRRPIAGNFFFSCPGITSGDIGQGLGDTGA